MKRIFYFEEQRMAAEHFAREFDIPKLAIFPVNNQGHGIEGLESQYFLVYENHMKKVPDRLMEELERKGFILIKLNDHFTR